MSLYTSWFSCADQTMAKAVTEDTEEEEEPLECDYDDQATKLYEALEDKNWRYALDYYMKPDQVRTWVTRYDILGNVRWTQLPLHAALLFRAPTNVVTALIEAYPKGVRCIDDQTNLPLHLAFRHGASVETIWALIEKFPNAVRAKGHKDREPLACAPFGSNEALYNIINTYTDDFQERYEAQRSSEIEKAKEVEASLEQEKEKFNELQRSTRDLVENERQTKQELAKVKEKLDKKTSSKKGLKNIFKKKGKK